MSAETIWWGQLGSSLRLLDRTADAMRDCRSAVLCLPARLPWRNRFYERLDERRSSFDVNRRLTRLSWTSGAEPGQYVLDRLCTPQVRAEYWPGQPLWEYLREKVNLGSYYVWITGIHSREDLSRWTSFLARYGASGTDHTAVFLLEYDGPPAPAGPAEEIAFQVEDYHCRVFCLELAAELTADPFRSYRAELALCIGGGDPELCAALLEAGDALPEDPVAVARTVMEQGRDSDGQPFPQMGEGAIASAVWLAAVMLLFPALERYRLNFISRHERELARHLPIQNSNGEVVTEPADMEIGALYYVATGAAYDFPVDEAENIRLCRETRNLLAHNKPAPYEDVKRVLSL